MISLGRVAASCLCFLVLGGSTPAQTPDPSSWSTASELPAVDQSALSAAQKQALLNVLRTKSCNCGCGMKIAECRMKDPKCGSSRGLAAKVAQELREGKSSDAIGAGLDKLLKEGPPLLGDPVRIPIDGAPSKGPANAKITLVEFSDFQ
ncbi:MAG: hypothetical protein DMG57_37690 [Acidobacteria bacterium]|nr:MAG: hypothetical protein DMG57_37690 [Acidobacteriota bacterium]